MAYEIGEARSINELVVRVDAALQGVDASGDKHSLPTLALNLCHLIFHSLSDDQKQAIAAARCYLETGKKEDADRWINKLASRIGNPYPPGTEERAIAEDRLIWISLNRNGPLSGYGVEFVLSFGEMAGIPFDQLLVAFQEVFPRLSGSGNV